MRNHHRIVGALVALGLFAAVSTAQAKEPTCPDDKYKSYSWLDYGKCAQLRSTEATIALTDGWFTRFQTTCPVTIEVPNVYVASYSGNCDPIYKALLRGDKASIRRDDGVFYLTLLRTENRKTSKIIDDRPLLPVKIKFEDGETRTVGYRTDKPVELEAHDGKETLLLDYYVYLSYKKYGNRQIKFYTIEAFDLDASASCQAERPDAKNTKIVDCDQLSDSASSRQASARSGEAHIEENRSGGGGEPMPNQ